MERACQTVILNEARVSVAKGGSWSHGEHEHAEAQVTVHLPVHGQVATFDPRTRIVPPHAPHAGGCRFGASSVVFHFKPEILEAAADEIYGIAGFDLRGGEVQDPLIVDLAEAALREMEFGAASSLLLDYIANVLVGRLIRAYAGLPEGHRRRRSLLTPRQLRTLREFIESRFDVGTSVRQLGAVIGLGPQRLTALLKASTGLTPHAYVTHLRIISAGRLLKQNQLTLAEIALTLGFVGQSHFGTVFRRYLGVTPRHYRRVVQMGV
jgi:AraC family transcriptional regulator